MLDIIIIGGGIGGLATALALQRTQQVSVRVFERDESFDCRSQGYSLTLQQGLFALDKLGVGKKVRKASTCKISAHQIMTSTGKVLAVYDKKYGTKGGKGNTPIPRELLRKILMDALLPDTITWNKQLSGYEEVEDKVRVVFSDGTELICDGLIGCDGIHSFVRKELIGDPLVYLGVLAVNGIVQTDHALTYNRVIQTLDGNSRIFIKPFNKGSSMWQLTIPMSDTEAHNFPVTDLQKAKDLALEIVAGWHEPIPQMVQDTQLSSMRCGPVYDRNPLAPWPTRRITILGDSCHPMSPFKGQGANQALEDAVDIANLLVEHQNVLVAFQKFETIMLQRSGKYQTGSRRNVHFLHTPKAIDIDTLHEHLHIKGESREKMISVIDQINNNGCIPETTTTTEEE